MQFSLRALLLAFIVFAVGLTLIMAASPGLAEGLYALYAAGLLFCLVGAVGWRGTCQVFCLGAMAVGATYWYAAFVAHAEDESRDAYARAMHSYPYVMYGGMYGNNAAANDTEETFDTQRPRLITNRLIDWMNRFRRSRIAVGDHVFAKWVGNGYYWGRVISVDESPRATVQLDGYGGVTSLPVSRLQVIEPHGLSAGDSAEFRLPDGSLAKALVVGTLLIDEPLYEVTWNDSSTPSQVPPDKITPEDVQADVRKLAVGAKVQAVWPPSTTYFPGTITRITTHAQVGFEVKLADGTTTTAQPSQLLPPDKYDVVQGDRVTVPAQPFGGSTVGVVATVSSATEPYYEVRWDDGSPPTFTAAKDIRNRRAGGRAVGHCVFGLWLSLLGGWLATALRGASYRPNKHDIDVEPVSKPCQTTGR